MLLFAKFDWMQPEYEAKKLVLIYLLVTIARRALEILTGVRISGFWVLVYMVRSAEVISSI